MFENSGTKIRSYASIIFIIEAIAILILAIILGNENASYDPYTGDSRFAFGIFLLVLIVGIPCAYITCLFLSAFGELVESATRAADNTDEMLRRSGPNSGSTIGNTTNYTPKHSWDQPTTPTRPATPRQSGPDFWKCPICGKENHKTCGTCGCGTRKPN